MSPECFAQIMQPLSEKYPKHFIPETMKPLYKLMGHLTIDQGQEIVGKIILRNPRFPPNDQDFKDALAELNRPQSYFKPIDTRNDPIFTDQEKAEIWQFVKDMALGKYNESQIKSYTEVLNEAIDTYYKHNK